MEELRARQTELVNILTALNSVLQSKDWQVLQELVFGPLVERIDRQLLAEAKSKDPRRDELKFLQGQLAIAKRFDLETFGQICKKELEGIKQKLQ